VIRDPNDPNDTPKEDAKTPDPPDAVDPNDSKQWQKWYADLCVAVADQDAVLRDLLRRKRHRHLGTSEAKRLYHEARDKLAGLLARADEDGRAPSGAGGSPVH
jgi:hypothetical protein